MVAAISRRFDAVYALPLTTTFTAGRPNVRLVMMMRSLRSVPMEPSLEASLSAEGVMQ